MRCGRTFRLARTHPAHARLSGSETLSRSRSLVAYTIDMHESEFSEATPLLRAQARVDALRPLLLLHSFRFVGLAFLVKGVVAPELPAAFAVPAAYGDLIAAVLALIVLAALRSGFGIPLVWVFDLWGSADLLYVFYQGNASGMASGMLQA